VPGFNFLPPGEGWAVAAACGLPDPHLAAYLLADRRKGTPMRPKFPRPVHDADARAGGGLGDLPEWDLSDLYAAPDAPELTRDMDWLRGECADFAADYEGKLAGLDADGMLACIARNERISAVAGRIMSFAGLRYYQNTLDAQRAKFMSDCL
jgi:oligoendopeptidase F